MKCGCNSNITTAIFLKMWVSGGYLFVRVCVFSNCKNEFMLIISVYVADGERVNVNSVSSAKGNLAYEISW